MRDRELKACKFAIKWHGRIGEAFLMRKLCVTWEKAKQIIEEYKKCKVFKNVNSNLRKKPPLEYVIEEMN